MSYLARLVLLVGLVAAPVRAQADSEHPPYRPLSLSLFHPATTWLRTDPMVTGLSLNLLDGNHRGVYGLEVGPVLNRTRERMYGLQLAGIINLVLGELLGVQVAAGVNVVLRPSGGVQLGGLWNHASSIWTPSEAGFSGVQLSAVGNSADLMAGVQLSALMNVAGQLVGAQVAGINIAYSKLDGLQVGLLNLHTATWIVTPPRAIAARQARSASGFARFEVLQMAVLNNQKTDPFWPMADLQSHLVQLGLVNVASYATGLQAALFINSAQRFRGFQWSMVFGNIALISAYGVQLAPIINYVGVYMEGFQLSLLNICGSLRGVQLGLINICGRVHGVQLGAINIAYRNKVPFLPVLNIGL